MFIPGDPAGTSLKFFAEMEKINKFDKSTLYPKPDHNMSRDSKLGKHDIVCMYDKMKKKLEN